MNIIYSVLKKNTKDNTQLAIKKILQKDRKFRFERSIVNLFFLVKQHSYNQPYA